MTVVLPSVADARRWVKSQQSSGKSVGFAPTMGALHDGHLSLMRRARQRCNVAIASVFVNPLQFGPSEDFDRYPRDFARDLAMIESEKVDAVFHPDVKEMYPAAPLTFVEVPELSGTLCGASRPGHFRGVATVVAKLFQIVPADVAFFGQKDAQQVAVIRRMVRDLNIPIEIEACPIVREPDGLAMSSRNVYLNPDQRKQASALFRSLQAANKLIESGARDAGMVEAAVRQIIEQAQGAEIDYAEVVDFDTLQPLATISGSTLIAVAVRFGKTRLIDNIVVEVEKLRK